MTQEETSRQSLKVYIVYSSVDYIAAQDIYKKLSDINIDVWFDREELVPGVDWKKLIKNAIRDTDLALICMSSNTVNKEGFFQREVKSVLDRYDEKPEGSLFIIPLRLDDCQIPNRLKEFETIDIFEEGGWKRLLELIELKKSQVFTRIITDDGNGGIVEELKRNGSVTPNSEKMKNQKDDSRPKQTNKWLSLLFSRNTSELLNTVNTILKEVISPSSGDVEKIAASQIKLLTSYYSLVLNQAQRSFTWALIWATVGVLGFILAGFFLLVNQIKDIALIATIGSAIVEVISGINFYLFNKASTQLAEFHTRLDVTQKLLLSNAVAEKIDGDLKQITRSYIALKFAGIEVAPEAIEKSLDMTPKVRITHIELNPSGSDIAKEFVSIENSGKAVADMTNWSLSDEAGHTFRFPMFFLKPNTSVLVWTRNGKNTSSDLYWKMKRAVWNNTEDVAFLKDSGGNLIDSFRYYSKTKDGRIKR